MDASNVSGFEAFSKDIRSEDIEDGCLDLVCLERNLERKNSIESHATSDDELALLLYFSVGCKGLLHVTLIVSSEEQQPLRRTRARNAPSLAASSKLHVAAGFVLLSPRFTVSQTSFGAASQRGGRSV